MKSKDTISVTIMSPQAVVWQGDALSLSSHNSEGAFDLLPDHARFMTILEAAPISISLPEGKEQSFSFAHAVLFFHDNAVKIYTHQM